MSLLAFKDVVKKYDMNISVNHLSLSIEEGEIFGLLGPNGAGKSTSIHLLAGLLRPDSGTITLDGFDVVRQPRETKARLGLVPQELAIYESLTAYDNVAFFARLYGLRGRLLKERVTEALEFVGLSQRAKEHPSSYSGGMKRRLNIACAITHRPRVIIMDEPTVGIDPQSRNHILESVRTLNKLGSTIIYTSHYMEEVEAIGTRVGIIDQGRLIACGTKDELVAQSGQKEKLVIEANRIAEEAVAEIQHHPRVEAVHVLDNNRLELYMQEADTYMQDILFILGKHHMGLLSLMRDKPNLERLFLQLTGRKLRD